jgi:hypothetical protein
VRILSKEYALYGEIVGVERLGESNLILVTIKKETSPAYSVKMIDEVDKGVVAITFQKLDVEAWKRIKARA